MFSKRFSILPFSFISSKTAASLERLDLENFLSTPIYSEPEKENHNSSVPFVKTNYFELVDKEACEMNNLEEHKGNPLKCFRPGERVIWNSYENQHPGIIFWTGFIGSRVFSLVKFDFAVTKMYQSVEEEDLPHILYTPIKNSFLIPVNELTQVRDKRVYRKLTNLFRNISSYSKLSKLC